MRVNGGVLYCHFKIPPSITTGMVRGCYVNMTFIVSRFMPIKSYGLRLLTISHFGMTFLVSLELKMKNMLIMSPCFSISRHPSLELSPVGPGIVEDEYVAQESECIFKQLLFTPYIIMSLGNWDFFCEFTIFQAIL